MHGYIWASHPLDSHHMQAQSHAETCCWATFRLYTCIFGQYRYTCGWGHRSGSSSAAAEIFSDLETQIPPAAIFPGYTVIRDVGWAKTGCDSVPHPSLPLVYRGWCGHGFRTIVRMSACKPAVSVYLSSNPLEGS